MTRYELPILVLTVLCLGCGLWDFESADIDIELLGTDNSLSALYSVSDLGTGDYGEGKVHITQCHEFVDGAILTYERASVEERLWFYMCVDNSAFTNLNLVEDCDSEYQGMFYLGLLLNGDGINGASDTSLGEFSLRGFHISIGSYYGYPYDDVGTILHYSNQDEAYLTMPERSEGTLDIESIGVSCGDDEIGTAHGSISWSFSDERLD